MFHYNTGTIYDFVLKEQLCNGGISNRPLHDLAMGQQHVRLGTALYALKRLRSPVYEIKMDSILYRAPKWAKLSVTSLPYESVHSARDMFEGRAQRLNQGCALSQWQGSGLVFRVQTRTEDDFLKCNPKKFTRTHELRLTHHTWKELGLEEAEHRVLQGQSLLVKGASGTRKTYMYVPRLG